ncbi:uncharacterized protein LOC126837965 isoform X2 [Adelges cooleyi]|uniref:uncharacterized protein LOC126837965 isoform X2 n=1 Tax=Adelges cooleyi TaxID=133065 RepID=UPI0021806D5D|nr:uncharacterized protein LOC126837965 isoform X2 [Adelges cooleyi]
MKLFCLLISFFFVEVLADYATYKEYVNITTEAIKLVYEKNDLTVEGRSGANGLEHLIETMVTDDNEENYKNFCKMNLLIAVPDQPEIVFGILEHMPLPPMQKAKLFNHIMLKEIEDILDLGTLKDLGDERRNYIVPALRNLIRCRILDEAVQHVDDDAFLLANCRLLGLYLSTQFPKSYIKEIEIDTTDRTCILTDKRNGKRRYRKNGNTWSEISLSNIDQTQQFLEEQLRLRIPPIAQSSDESDNSTDEEEDDGPSTSNFNNPYF